jgi:hypothetical protein
MTRKEQAKEHATATAIEKIGDHSLRNRFIDTHMDIQDLPIVCHDATDNLTDAGHFALMALGEMDA